MGGSSKTKSTTTVNVPPPGPEEVFQRNLANAINQAGLEQAGYDVITTPEGGVSLQKRAPTPDELEEQEFNKMLQKQIRQRLLGGPIDPESKRLVGEVYESQRTLGEEDIDRFMRELAGSRGLDLATDTPVLREAGLARSRLETGLRGAEAASLLDVGNRQQLFAQALREFQTGLTQQAFLNRQMISENATGVGLGLSQQRLGTASKTTSGTAPGDNSQLIGAGIGAAGAIASAAIMA